MDALLSVNWIALLVLIIALLLFKVLNKLAYKINWTFVILISMVMGAVLGIVFASENNSYMTWLALIGDIYVIDRSQKYHCCNRKIYCTEQ